jgi:dihydroorotate dehydrogenase electron transfer subunit
MTREAVSGRIDQDGGPLRVLAEVVGRRRTGPYVTLTVASSELSGRCRPGHFLEVAVQAPGTLLRRPLSVARAEPAAGGMGTVEIVIGPDGPGSVWLSEVSAGATLDIVGPLGRPFPLPTRPASCLLVGGGYGAAPLHFLTEVLAPAGHRVDLVVGASSEDMLLHSLEAKRLAHRLHVTTDDGSAGHRGRVTDVIEDIVARSETDVIYACGPNAMLAAVSAVAVRLAVPVRVSLEERMACGLGVCFTCVIPVRDRDGEVQMRRSCIDGPVMDGSRVDWGRMGLGHAEEAATASLKAAGTGVTSGRPSPLSDPTAELDGVRS